MTIDQRKRCRRLPIAIAIGVFWSLVSHLVLATPEVSQIGREVGLVRHLQPGEASRLPIAEVLEHGRQVFTANWTPQEGGGRAFTKGTGKPLADETSPLTFPRNFNRLSAPDANACSGCHNAPFGIAGGGGDFVTNVFVLAQRFDAVTFDQQDPIPTRGDMDERGFSSTLETIGNSRATVGMMGSGYIEMLARQITADLRALRDNLGTGSFVALESKGISFGRLRRGFDGSWDVSEVEGLPHPSIATSGADDPPSLTIMPFHQAGAVVSLRQFSNNAFNHHHGIQSAERFGVGQDPDNDGYYDELTWDDITAVSLFQAALPVPGRVIPRDGAIEVAVRRGEKLFKQIGCAGCHIPELPLDGDGFRYTEPGPYNPPGNLTPDQVDPISINLNDRRLPGPRLRRDPRTGITWVPVFSDFKLHDITSGPNDPNREPLNMHFEPGSDGFFAGNGHFLTRRLWGAANEPPYFHHGKFTTLREATLAHAGDALDSRKRFEALRKWERDAVIEFLKTLQVLPPGARHNILDERYQPRRWP